MNTSTANSNTNTRPSSEQKKYKGVRCRKWGKWVSEIRVPGTQERLWLGSYSTAEAAAVAHDVASYCLRGENSSGGLNFPLMLPASIQADMSPQSIQRAASNAGMAIDAQMILSRTAPSKDGDQSNRSHESNLRQEAEPGWEDDGVGSHGSFSGGQAREDGGEGGLSISVEDYLQF